MRIAIVDDFDTERTLPKLSLIHISYNTCTPEGVDECTSWGDYFYMEALTRLTKDWEMYW